MSRLCRLVHSVFHNCSLQRPTRLSTAAGTRRITASDFSGVRGRSAWFLKRRRPAHGSPHSWSFCFWAAVLGVMTLKPEATSMLSLFCVVVCVLAQLINSAVHPAAILLRKRRVVGFIDGD